MKKIAIVQSNYIPWVGYFHMIDSVDEFILFDDVQYTKRDWRNRNIIKTSQGSLKLTIPVLSKGNFYQKIKETKISNPDWGQNHWETLRVNYRRSKYFEEIEKLIKPIYLENNFEKLSDVNEILIKEICNYLNITTKISNTSDYKIKDGKTERLIDLCIQAEGEEYVSGPAAKVYIKEELFNDAKISLSWFEYHKYDKYPQLWGDFIENLSIIDLLFNCGHETIDIISKHKKV